jgi:hypothetical protein
MTDSYDGRRLDDAGLFLAAVLPLLRHERDTTHERNVAAVIAKFAGLKVERALVRFIGDVC